MSKELQIQFSANWSENGAELTGMLSQNGGATFTERMLIAPAEMQDADQERGYFDDSGSYHVFDINAAEAALEEAVTKLAQRMMTRAIFEGFLRP